MTPLIFFSDCSSKPIKLSQYSEFELTTPGYPAAHTGSLSCTMRFEAPPGMKPLLEFLVWELADCGSDRINVIDRKEMISNNLGCQKWAAEIGRSKMGS